MTPPFVLTCIGTTSGAILQGAVITVRVPLAGGGSLDLTGVISGTGSPSLGLQQALALVQPSGQPGLPCAVVPGQACQVVGAVSGSGLVTGSMSWTLSAALPAGVAAGAVPVAVISTAGGVQGFPCGAAVAGATAVACTGTTSANALQGSLATVVFAAGVTAVGTVSGTEVAILPLAPPPPINLPPPPPPPIVPFSPALPSGAPTSGAGAQEVPLIPEADTLLLVAVGLLMHAIWTRRAHR
jgi:hypothetical protein